VERLVAKSPDSVTVAAAASMHRNGYAREAAVRLLASMSSGEEFRWLIVRCLDPVPQVRSVALEAVRARCLDPDRRGAYLEALAAAAPLLESEKTWTPEAMELRTALHSILLSTAGRPALRAASGDADLRTRRSAVRLLSLVEPSIALLEAQLVAGDVVATTTVAEALQSDPTQCEQAAHLLLRSKVARLRQLGLWHVISHGHERGSVLEHALLDAAPGVRDIAQRHPQPSGLDVAGWYREQIPNHPLGALLGLGDAGGSQDVTVAHEHLATDKARVRAAAARLIARLGSREELPTLLDLAGDDSGRVSREATMGVRRHGVSDDVARRALALATAPNSAPVRRRLFTGILKHASRWTSAEVALIALIHADDTVRLLGGELLAYTVTTWNSSQTSPAPGRLQELNELIAAAESASPSPESASALAEFHDIVSTWRSS
jgi:hypothetical protein